MLLEEQEQETQPNMQHISPKQSIITSIKEYKCGCKDSQVTFIHATDKNNTENLIDKAAFTWNQADGRGQTGCH